MSDTNLSSFIWSIAELLRNDYKQSEYGKVILPFTLLRRLDQVLEPTKDVALETAGGASSRSELFARNVHHVTRRDCGESKQREA